MSHSIHPITKPEHVQARAGPMGSCDGLQVCPVARIGNAGSSTPSVAPLTYANRTPELAASAEPEWDAAPDLAGLAARRAVPGRAAGLPGGRGVRETAVEGL